MATTTPSTPFPVHLSDGALTAEVTRLARSERGVQATLIAHLAELYSRRLHEREGFSSLFTYCTDVLKFSDHEAYDRMKAAKVARRYPAVVGLLADGRMNLTTVRLLAPHLTRQNHQELLAEASGKRKRQVLELLARWFPKPDVPTTVRKLPQLPGLPLSPAAVLAVSQDSTPGPPSAEHERIVFALQPAVDTAGTSVSRPVISSAPRPVVKPLSPDRYQVTFTATGETREKLELAQELLRHVIPNGDPAQIFARALDALVEQLVKQKFAVTDRPRTRLREGDDVSRHVPAEVKRTVYVRDSGRCAFVASGGRRCGARGLLEFHHVAPYAAGGRASVENIELRCRAHNGYEAAVFFGPMKEYVAAVGTVDAEGMSKSTATAAAGNRVNVDAFRSGTKATMSAP